MPITETFESKSASLRKHIYQDDKRKNSNLSRFRINHRYRLPNLLKHNVTGNRWNLISNIEVFNPAVKWVYSPQEKNARTTEKLTLRSGRHEYFAKGN